MTDLMRAFDEAKVKRGTGAQGGQFTSKGAAPPPKGGAGKGGKKSGPRRGDAGNLSFDGRRGTGYGTRGGDKRVRALQEALNRLGLTDASGKKLAVDGQLGPRTTAAIKKAQRKLGLKPDGIVTPALLKRLTAAKSLGKAKPVAEFKRTPGSRAGGTTGRPSERKGDRSPKERKAKRAPRKRAARAEKPAPTKRAAAPAVGSLARSMRYSGPMDETMRHLPGRHNQGSHGNRFRTPGDRASGLRSEGRESKKTDQARKGTDRVRLGDEVVVAETNWQGAPNRGLGGKVGRHEGVEGDGPGVIVRLPDGRRQVIDRRDLRVKRTASEMAAEDKAERERLMNEADAQREADRLEEERDAEERRRKRRAAS